MTSSRTGLNQVKIYGIYEQSVGSASTGHGLANELASSDMGADSGGGEVQSASNSIVVANIIDGAGIVAPSAFARSRPSSQRPLVEHGEF